MSVVSLLTDFGLADTYVGQLKAAILAVAPSAALVDVTHAIPPQDVHAGAFALWTAIEVFPAGSVHVAVVDPGVGSARRAVAARARRGDVCVGPDNGLLVPALERLGGIAHAVALTDAAFWRAERSSTFHGRDVFGRVAGHVATGTPLERLGPAIELARPFALELADGLLGEVVHIDAYGNLITNIAQGSLPTDFSARIGSHTAAAAGHYAAVECGELLAYVGSAGLLEIAVRDGSAAALTGARRGDRVSVERR